MCTGLCICVFAYVYMGVGVCTCVEGKGQHWMCSSIAHRVPFETVSLLNSAALDGQQAPEILQHLPVQHWDYRHVLLFFSHVGAKNANSGYLMVTCSLALYQPSPLPALLSI